MDINLAQNFSLSQNCSSGPDIIFLESQFNGFCFEMMLMNDDDYNKTLKMLTSPFQLCATTVWEGVGTSLVRCIRETGLANFRYTQCFRYSCGFLWGLVQKQSPGLVFCTPLPSPPRWERNALLYFKEKNLFYPTDQTLRRFCTLPNIFILLHLVDKPI